MLMMNKMFIGIIFMVLIKFVSAVDYCGLCENGTHTMCKYEGRARNCPGYRKKELAIVEKKYIVDIHNDIRNHVASGMETRGALGSQPPATDMSMLEWDDELAEIAQRWADQCIKVNETTQHDICKRTERFEVGQNILTAITSDPDVPELSVLIFNWYQQVVNVIPSDIDIFLGVRKGKHLIGQYTQLVWAETRFVGCGLVTFTESDYEAGTYQHRLVCNYGPAGNIFGEAVYQRGPPCTKCRTRKCDTVRPSLCQGTDLKDTKFDYIENEEYLQANIALFSSNATKINNAICFNPDEPILTKCITGISQTNITSPSNNLNTKNGLKYITLGALASGEIGLHKPDQTTLKNLIALWKKLKLRNITDTFDIFLSHDWSENAEELYDKLNKPTSTSTTLKPSKVDSKTNGIVPKLVLLANLVKYATKQDESKENASNEEDFKNASYISTVIPSITVTTSVLENILNQNMTVLHSSQEANKPLIIDKDFDVYGSTQNLIQETIQLHSLGNGIVMDDGGDEHYRQLKDARHRALQSYFKLNQDFTDMGDLDLPAGGQFRKERGAWHDGHCICENMDMMVGTTSAAAPKFATVLWPTLLLISNIIHAIICTLYII